MKDLSDPAVQQEYDDKIWRQARELNHECGQNTELMAERLRALGVDEGSITIVNDAQLDPEWDASDDYIGDEVVYEAIKDALRPIYGFAASPMRQQYSKSPATRKPGS